MELWTCSKAKRVFLSQMMQLQWFWQLKDVIALVGYSLWSVWLLSGQCRCASFKQLQITIQTRGAWCHNSVSKTQLEPIHISILLLSLFSFVWAFKQFCTLRLALSVLKNFYNHYCRGFRWFGLENIVQKLIAPPINKSQNCQKLDAVRQSLKRDKRSSGSGRRPGPSAVSAR